MKDLFDILGPAAVLILVIGSIAWLFWGPQIMDLLHVDRSDSLLYSSDDDRR